MGGCTAQIIITATSGDHLKNKRPKPTRLYHTLWSNFIYSCALADKFATKRQKSLCSKCMVPLILIVLPCTHIKATSQRNSAHIGTHWYTFGTHLVHISRQPAHNIKFEYFIYRTANAPPYVPCVLAQCPRTIGGGQWRLGPV